MQLPDFCEVYPAHGAGSLCGRAMGAKRTSTIGYERKYNAALQIRDKSAFIASLTTRHAGGAGSFCPVQRDQRRGTGAPAHASRPGPNDGRSHLPNGRESRDVVVLDIRPFDAFGGQHVPGAWNIDFNGNFATFAGWTLPADGEILLVADSDALDRKAAIWLRRVGIDHVTGFLDGGMLTWTRPDCRPNASRRSARRNCIRCCSRIPGWSL